MDEQGVVSLLEVAEELSVTLWIDGGWGVDALIGRQTRTHNDIDVFIESNNAAKFIDELKRARYKEKQMDYTTSFHSVWVQGKNTVDLHLFEFDARGAVVYEGETYPSWVLGGHGVIGGVEVLCMTPEAQLLFHQGYELDEHDKHDVKLLCETFHLELPKSRKKG
jgi:lincosamide nucleotidyltransferase A/C/D/E